MEKTVVIICDGQFPRTEYPRYLIRMADFTICCDGALTKYLSASKSIFGEERTPDLVIGDMDTLSQAMQKKYSDIIIKENEQEHILLENWKTKYQRFIGWIIMNSLIFVRWGISFVLI